MAALADQWLSCPEACGIFPGLGWNPCPLHWQVDSYALNHHGSPKIGFSKPYFGIITDSPETGDTWAGAPVCTVGRWAFTVKAREYQALWSFELSYNCSAVPCGIRTTTDDMYLSEHGCVPVKLYLKAGGEQDLAKEQWSANP